MSSGSSTQSDRRSSVPGKPAPASGKPGRASDPRDTPAMRQYTRFKETHPDCILFFRMGDFYEMFDDDAVTCHRELGITLTERTKGVPMAGVPYHAVENYLRRMIEKGYRVAVCEQMEDPKQAKGVVKRAVTRVLTPGTLIDETLLDESRPNRVAALMFTGMGDESAAVCAIAELSTGAFTLINLESNQVLDELARLAPSEVLFVETADGNPPPRVKRVRDLLGCALTARAAWSFRHEEARDLLLEHFGVRTVSGFGLADDDPALGPAGALVRYLQETQIPEDSVRDGDERLLHLRPPRRESTSDFVIIDATSQRSLEIERTMRTGQTSGSLLDTLQRAKTPMGKRLLREWLLYPLRDIETIRTRQRAVGAFIEDRDFADQIAHALQGVQDVARIAQRISLNRAAPRDLVALGRSVARLANLLDLFDARPAFESLRARLEALRTALLPLADRIAAECREDAPSHLREGGLFNDGIDAELDEARLLQRDANAWLAKYQAKLINETAIPSLKVGYNKVFGYYIEVTHTHGRKVPDSFNRKQTLKNAERYITPELKEFEEKVTTAESRAIEREKQLFDKLCRTAAKHTEALLEYAQLIGEADVLLAFGENAARWNYTKPEIVDEPVLIIRGGRHPVLDRTLKDGFVPNDCTLGRPKDLAQQSDEEEVSEKDAATLALITGPNMAGKSTFIRQVALITLLAHTGAYVPADHATIGLVDRIFTRIGASDELHAGQSTFMVEMTETANILHHATDRSLIILDEIGRGTSTLDGLSLAWAIAETLADVRCRTLFATHYHELTSLADRLEQVRNLHVAVREWGNPGEEEIIFLYRILPGRSDRSYGIHVAKIAGLPSETVTRAQDLLDTLAVQTGPNAAGVEAKSSTRANDGQLSLFTEYVEHPLLDEIRQLRLDALTPMEAFDRLRKMQDKLKS